MFIALFPTLCSRRAWEGKLVSYWSLTQSEGMDCLTQSSPQSAAPADWMLTNWAEHGAELSVEHHFHLMTETE